MSARVLAAVVVLFGCRFDERGLAGPPRDAAGADDGGVVDRGDAADDGGWADAAAPCVDRDDDGFLAVGVPDADCEPPADCDDSDPDAYPGQTESFSEPRTSGGFDYDCDGVDSPALDTTQGGDCYWDWFSCEGTGWYGPVPACGQQGIWHTCAPDDYRCVESGAELLRMPCR
jgi:hypothetical protein